MYTAAAWIAADAASQSTAAQASPMDLMPGFAESLYIGAALPGTKHMMGFESGGAIGYSTFFTGYREGMGRGRQMSLGRAALQVVGGAARMLASTGLAGQGRFGDYVNLAQNIERIGFGGLAGATFDDIPDPARFIKNEQLGGKTREAFMKKGATIPPPKANVGDAHRYLTGFFGGAGYERVPDGKGGLMQVARTKTETYAVNGKRATVTMAKEGSKGVSVLNNRVGRLAGTAMKSAGWLELGLIVAGAAGSAAGAAYGMTRGIVDRVHQQRSGRMSGGYTGVAAGNERRRAVMALQSSALDPGTQLMGNEAANMH